MESLCTTCLRSVTCHVAEEDGQVVLKKHCDLHGEQSVLLETNLSLFAEQERRLKKLPRRNMARLTYPEGSFMVRPDAPSIVFELTDDCNQTCGICIAGSFQGAGGYKSDATLMEMISYARKNTPASALVFISGGEPTIHNSMEFVIDAVYRVGFHHVVLISNGKRFADEPRFCHLLKQHFPDLEVFLQFDSLDLEVLLEIRGMDLRETRERAIENLAAAGVHSTLVSVIQGGRSMELAWETVEVAREIDTIRGVQFQPLRASGRHAQGGVLPSTAPTPGDVIDRLSRDLPFVRVANFSPHPRSPGSVVIGYWDRSNRMECVTESVLQEMTPVPLFLPPSGDSTSLLRVTVMNYLDKFNFRSDIVEAAPVSIVTPEAQLVPLDLYYLLGGPKARPVALTLRSRSAPAAVTKVETAVSSIGQEVVIGSG